MGTLYVWPMHFFIKINNFQLLPSADTVVTIVYTVLPVCMAGDGYPPLLHTGSCPRPCQWWVITGEQRHTHPSLGAPAGLLCWYIQLEAGGEAELQTKVWTGLTFTS